LRRSEPLSQRLTQLRQKEELRRTLVEPMVAESGLLVPAALTDDDGGADRR
jgi:hypothetical protein